MSEKWYDSNDPGRVYRGARNLALRWVFGIAVVVLVIAVGVWGFNYLTAETRGRAALHNEARTAAELRDSYEFFHDTCNAVLAQGENIGHIRDQLRDLRENAPTVDPLGQYQQQVVQVQTQLTGLENIRSDTAHEYNSRSHQFTRNFMRSRDLPVEIGPPTGDPYESLVCER